MPPLPPIVFEDDFLLALAKPGGLPVAPDPRDRARTSLIEAVRASRGPGVATVHRIDDEASGLVLFAKTKPALDSLSGQFQAKTVEAVYQALTVGAPEPDAGVWEFVLKPDEAAPERMCLVKKRGHATLTAYTVRGRFGRFAQVECRPRTARRHQVRVHLAANGTPVLNDAIYGDGTVLLLSGLKRGYKGREDERPLMTGLALHASELTCRHPATQAVLKLEAPLPKEFSVALKYLRKFCP